MAENTSGILSVDTYLAKQEGHLIEHIRRLLQAETKVTLLETGIQELHRKNKDLGDQLDNCNVMLEQSIAGLSAVTAERNQLQEENKTLKQSLDGANGRLNELLAASSDRDRLQKENEVIKESLKSCNSRLNEQLIVNTELEKLKERLRVSEESYSTLKENYNKVLESLSQMQSEPEPVQPAPEKKSKRVKSTESEWTDGKY